VGLKFGGVLLTTGSRFAELKGVAESFVIFVPSW